MRIQWGSFARETSRHHIAANEQHADGERGAGKGVVVNQEAQRLFWRKSAIGVGIFCEAGVLIVEVIRSLAASRISAAAAQSNTREVTIANHASSRHI